LQFLPLNDQIIVFFVRAAGVLAKGRMFDMPELERVQSHQAMDEGFGKFKT
jgi:hypothetical protein